MANREEYEIGIDCAPGELRPDYYFKQILLGTGMHLDDFEKPTQVFGAWSWRLRIGDGRIASFLEARAAFDERLQALCDSQTIRGAHMTPPVSEFVVVPR